jgi:tetratricopeptide (TPR) repeat protein
MFKGELSRLKGGETTEALLLHGPSGIGKSRLLEEFRYAVQLEDLACVVGANYEQGTSPYAPFITVLKGLIPAMKAKVPEALAQHAPVLVRLLPELDSACGSPVIPAPPLDSPTKDKLRLQSTILEVLTALAHAQGLVVILEDWQWADALSAELLDYLLRNMQAPATLFLITSRLGHEGQLEGARRVALTTLSDEGVRRMVISMLGTPEVDDRFVAQVAELSKGVPFFVEKLLEHLVQDQTLVHARGRWNTHVELPLNRLPNNLKGLLMWRITCLTEAAQRVAHVGAVVGRAIGIDVLKQVTGLGEDELFAALSALAVNQIFLLDADGAYQFGQDQIQELVYNNLEMAEKRRWHAAVAAVLESQIGGVTPEALALEQLTPLAHHFLEGGDRDKTILYALEAGKRAANLFANTEAEHFLSAGLARLREDETGKHDRARLEYVRALGDVYRVTGRNDRAKEAYLEAVTLAEALGERRMHGRMLTFLGRCYQVSGAFPDALAACERSLAICREEGDTAGAARCLLQMGRINLFLGNLSEATSHAERSLATARQTGDKVQIGEALAMLGYFYVASDPQKVEEGVENLHRALAFLTECDDKIALTTTYNFLGTAQNSMGNFQDAWASFSRNREICYEIGAKDDMIFALLNLAITAYELGNFAEMARWAKEAKSTATQLNSKYTLGMAITLDAVASAYTGQMALTLPLIQEQLELAREIRHKYMDTQVLLYQTEMLLLFGQLQEGRAAAEALKALIAETGDKEPEGRLNTLLAEILARLGDMAAAKQAADHALRHANATRAKGIQVRTQAVKAWVAMWEGSQEEARRLAEGTLVLAHRIGSQYQLARLWGLLGELAARAGKPDAVKHFREQSTIADAMGLRLLQAEACFGQAATTSDEADARALLQEAQGTLNALAAELDGEVRDRFLSLPERERILQGELSAFATRETDRVVDKVAPPRLGLNQGIWNKI